MKELSQNIGEKAVNYVLNYLKETEHKEARRCKKGKNGEGADIISAEGKYIEVKGCDKKETNLRIARQSLEKISKAGKLKQDSYFIYYVYNMEKEPTLMIFDYDTYNKNKFEETKLLIQPFKIEKETGKPERIKLKKMTSS